MSIQHTELSEIWMDDVVDKDSLEDECESGEQNLT